MEKVIEYNSCYNEVFETKKRYVILCGGANAGKSYFTQQLLLMRFLSIYAYNVLCVRKVFEAIGPSVFNLFLKLIKYWGVEANTEATIYKIKNKANDNLILFGGMNDAIRRENTKGKTPINGNFEAVFIEEATQLLLDDFLELDRRMRGKSETGLEKQIFLCFNPVMETHWIRKYFGIELSMDGATTNRDDVYVYRATIDNNRWATEADWKVLENYRLVGDEYSYMVYRYGLWGSVSAENVIIPYSLFWKARENRVTEPEGEYKIGCDPARFGTNEAVIYIGRGFKVMAKKVFSKSDSYQLADAICELDDTHRKDKSIPLRIKIDAGQGSGVIDILKARKLTNTTIYEVHNNGEPKDKAKYENIAAESWFEFRDIVEYCEFLPGDEEMMTQCSGRQYTYKEMKGRTGLGKTVRAIEPKEKYKKRYKELHGSSPDRADAIVLWAYTPPEQPMPGILFF